jgi:competence ComEA-like helix-hairpin-helix protein
MPTEDFLRQPNTEQSRIQSLAFVIAAAIAVCIAAGFVLLWFSAEQQSEVQLQGRINPNDAPPASLMRLPGIGITRAGAIVAYRESPNGSDNPAFRNCDDLQNVKGIGPKTAQSICQWLEFE